MTRGPFEFPIARVVDAVIASADREASPVDRADAIVTFAEEELGLVLLPWQREVIALLLEDLP